MNLGFDHEKYTQMQSERSMQRIDEFGGKLYLELGGKLFDDYHASRVLPGFQPDSKVQMLLKMKDKEEILIAVNANDVETSKVRGDLGITYDLDVLRLIDAFRGIGLYVGSVVLTRWAAQPAAVAFEQRLNAQGIKTYRHYPIEGYPTNIEHIVSDEGFGRNDYVETFPIWNLPLKHPVNVAYEAATADLSDVNMIDPFHLEAYGKTTVNYNRDIEIFPVLNALFEHVWGKSPYKSPTDMGVNMVGYCITDDEVCRRAAEKEIVRRYYAARCSYLQGHAAKEEAEKILLLMKQLNLDDSVRPVMAAARSRAEATGHPALAIELPNGEIVTGKTTELLGPSAAVILNALKKLARIPKKAHLISPEVVEPVQELKCKYLGNHNPRLHSDEVLVALSVSAATNYNAARALSKLPKLKNCEVHSTVILPAVDDNTFRRLGVNLTCDPGYQSHKLYHK